MFKTELDTVFLNWAGCPGEYLSVLDSITDLDECKKRVNSNAVTGWANGSNIYNQETDDFDMDFEQAEKIDSLLREKDMFATIYLGDHNNPWFPFFPREFTDKYQESCMKDIDGNRILLHDSTIRNGEGVPMPALDSSVVLKTSSESIRRGVEILKDNEYLTSWIVGAEEAYPEYFALGMGDFRDKFWQHFLSWLEQNDWDIKPEKERIMAKIDPDWTAWLHFREQAMADRAAYHMEDFLGKDNGHPIFYPTHGSPFCNDYRWKLGQTASVMSGVTDGLEMGHITIDDDDERLNPLYFAHFSSFGVPLIVPRLGNRTVDFSAQGRGRSYTPVMLRRLVYESLGMGAWHIGPIHWTSILHDGEWFIKGTEAEKECRAVFNEIKEARPVLDGMARLQPQLGIYTADDTWLEEWNPAWTGFYQDTLDAHWNTAIVSDTNITDELVFKMPVLISIDNYRIADRTLEKLERYLKKGGKILVWGDFAGYNEKNQPRDKNIINDFLLQENVYHLEIPPLEEKRTLINEFLSHIEGSHKEYHEYYPAPFGAIEKILKEQMKNNILIPAEVRVEDGPSRVNVYTLTDRTSLLFVLINNSDQDVELKLQPEKLLLDRDENWSYYRVLEEEMIDDINDTVLELEANATTMIMAYPLREKSVMIDTIEEAIAVFERWNESAVNTGHLKRQYERMLEEKDGGTLFKSYSLARTILSSLCLKVEVEQPAGGPLSLRVKVYNREMAPVENARLNVRIIPDRYRKRLLNNTGNGEYSLSIPVEKLPVFYNIDEESYNNIKGPVRLLLNAETDDHLTGGCLINTELV